MTSIIFVRHAHSTYTADERNRPLSAEGFQAALNVKNVLEAVRIDRFVSSPYLRAVQTIQVAANARGMEIEEIELFKERLLAGAPVDDFNHAIQKVWEDETFAWPGGESNQAAQARGVFALKQILNTYAGEQIVIGSHGNLIALIMNALDSTYSYDFWKRLTMPDVYKLDFVGEQLDAVTRLWRE
ncbi:phosphoglycerate mutase family 2 [Bacillus sp. JCM 19046]|nr:phosphoglycerate mutase family 2 [Bacillus sp. JCM 19045]GAF18549.1 phosphoglycerate mutase family 2 [Bacillus sp. JCM 19046]